MMLLATMHEIDQRHVPEKIVSLPILGSLRSFPWLVKVIHKQWPSMSYIDVWRAEIRGLWRQREMMVLGFSLASLKQKII